jgi:Flp pilus assembly pilin Flp
MKTIRQFLAVESGSVTIDYGFIAAGISLGIIAVVTGFGSRPSLK